MFPWRKQYFVDCTVLFSEEEKAIIHECGLGRHYFPVGPETPPPSNFLRTASILLQVFSQVISLTGCVAGCGMAIAGNSHADAFTGFMFFAAVDMYLANGRDSRGAERPHQAGKPHQMLDPFAVDDAALGRQPHRHPSRAVIGRAR